MQYIVFTDLDGTLVDYDTYSYQAALPAIHLLKEEGIPLVFCTSKTRAEIEVYLDELELLHPFISENGGAIFIPHGYFDVDFVVSRSTDKYDVIELGTDYNILRNVLLNIASSEGLSLVGFGDMTDAELSEDTGLDVGSACLAKQREYDEAFRLYGDENDADRLISSIGSKGLNYTLGGRYWHIIGDNDKGKAVRILTQVYRKQLGDIKTVGLGDSLNDRPMLMEVDIAFLVLKANGEHDPAITDEKVTRIPGVGPQGWNMAIMGLLE
ncbi:MAG: mannosyl-3-phosphoglycerate phosphatase [Methanolobus sp.]|nr:mannosyl-3-phosphoglycerate phosphatase [Methanolobus sp.]